jgi:ribonuclease-3
VVQGEHEELRYRLTGESGPDHAKSFEVEVWIGNRKISEGSGQTKKAAEQDAAYHALIKLREQE